MIAVTLTAVWLLVRVFHERLTSWNFLMQQNHEFIQNGVKNKPEIPLSEGAAG